MTHTVAGRPPSGGEDWAKSALSTLSKLAAVHRAGLALAEGGGRRLLFTASDRDGEGWLPWCEIDAYEDVPLTHTVRTGEPVAGSVNDLAVRYPAFIDRQASTTTAIACQPIVAAGVVLGGFVVFFEAPQPFDAAQRDELRHLGALLGGSLRRVQRTTAHTSRALESGPVPDGALCATYRVGADPRAVVGARHFVHTTLHGWNLDEGTVDDAVMCLNELVTNAILHTATGCEVRVVLDGGVLTTTVRDGGSSVLVDPSHVATDPLAVHGRGLQLVAGTSARWGSELDSGGMTVWFVLEPTHSPVG
ncbi:ATP-binding protein [Pedococcus sp. KACC 23699]|uniref:ATP-binding protein n=1 Tax=Pedococcus sp. KACC 23699 TaxID=3149228 RepID=A0AAU7JWI9_9MICO